MSWVRSRQVREFAAFMLVILAWYAALGVGVRHAVTVLISA